MRWIGFLGSWAIFILALGLATFAVAGEVINIRDGRRLERVATIDKLIDERTGNKAETLRRTAEQKATETSQLQQRVTETTKKTDLPDTGQTIIVSTTENKVYVRQNGQTVFEAIASTGKGTTLAVDGRTMIFDTPTGKFRVISKEENPVWVPPDWHYVEHARVRGMRVVRLNRGTVIDASSGSPAGRGGDGVWAWLGDSQRTMKVKGNSVVIDEGGYERELPPGEMIYAGDTVVIPPIGTPQRKFDKVLGRFRLNLGDGYALHGTQETTKLGQSVSHGCVRLGDSDIERLYQMASVGDEVVIY